jgi:hypothetical protein
MITVKDFQKATDFPRASKDETGRLRVGAAVGTAADTLERVAALREAGVDVVVVDTSHGHSQGVIDMVRAIKTRWPQQQVIAGNIVPRKDEKTGEMLLYADGKYEIRGEGTAAKPYRVSWECLASASETYVPRLQQREIPQRIAMLDGKVVEVEGYLAFPLMVSETKELLVMLNQWDGCCIGVPPTPYDAVEVKLTEPAKRGGWQVPTRTYRTRVDPTLSYWPLVLPWLMADPMLTGQQAMQRLEREQPDLYGGSLLHGRDAALSPASLLLFEKAAPTQKPAATNPPGLGHATRSPPAPPGFRSAPTGLWCAHRGNHP